MDNKDARRSRVPAGTFARSDPPPKPPSEPETAQAPKPDPAQERRRFASTLTGEEEVALAALDPEPDSADSEPTQRRHVSTLVGHAPGAPQPNVAPVLAPPKWRGAKPYLEGEEPQPRMSSIPTPPPVADEPASNPVQPRSRVTTKIGHVPAPAPETSAPDSAAIGDAIQEMLDGQASIPILEASDDDDLPLEELSPDELIDASNDPEPVVSAAAPSSTPALTSPSTAAAEPPIEVAPAAQLPAPNTSAPPVPPPAPAPAPLARIELKSTPRQKVSEESEPARPRKASPVPAAMPAAAAAAENEQGRPAAARKPAARAAGSLSPLEVTPIARDEAQTGLGAMLIAAMVVIGFGGWWVTRGHYPGPAHRALAHPEEVGKPPAPIPPAPKPIADTAPAAGPNPTLAASPATANAPRAIKPSVVLNAKRARPEPAQPKQPIATAAARTASSNEGVLRVTPHGQRPAGEAPETPSRDSMRDSLEAIRAPVSACVHGQHGVAQLDITVSNSGFVTYAVIGGDFAGTPEGSCIARVARTAQFEPFKKPRFRVIYPFSL